MFVCMYIGIFYVYFYMDFCPMSSRHMAKNNFIHKSRYITCNFKGCVYILGCMCKNHVMLTFNKVDGIYWHIDIMLSSFHMCLIGCLNP